MAKGLRLKSFFFPSKNTFSYFRRILRTSPRSWGRCRFIDSSTTTLHSTSLWNCWLCGQQFVFTRKKQIFKVILIDFKGDFFSSFFQLIILFQKSKCMPPKFGLRRFILQKVWAILSSVFCFVYILLLKWDKFLATVF